MSFSLNDFDKIIFDMDGVITSEVAYWQSAAVSAYDLLFSYEHYGKNDIDREWCRKQYKEIYNTIFCGGRTVKAVKQLGVNTNWDLLYIVFCVSKYIDSQLDRADASHFQSVCMFIENIDMKAPEIYDALSELVSNTIDREEKNFFKRGGEFFWKELNEVFDLWFHGCDEFEGIKTDDKLLFDIADIERVLSKLKNKGIRLGVGTGRPKCEIDYPLEKTGLDKYFDKELYVTYDDVLAAEKELNTSKPLAKPDPFVFLKAALGDKHSNKEIFDGEYTYEELERTLIVGDAPSDHIAATKGGFSFLGVLTGASGPPSKKFFEDNNADFIANSILDMEKYC